MSETAGACLRSVADPFSSNTCNGGVSRVPTTLRSARQVLSPHYSSVEKEIKAMKKIIFAAALLLLQPALAEAITVLAPNGGEKLAKGSIFLVRWETPTDTYFVNLSVLKGGKTVYGPKKLPTLKTSAGWSISWRVPDTLSPGNDYRLKLEDPKTFASDQSDANFTIRSEAINIEWPVGGEKLYVTNQHMIKWNAYGISSGLRILLIKGGLGYLLLETDELSGRFNWIVGKKYYATPYVEAGEYRIQIESGDRKLIKLSGPFTIALPTLTLAYPNGGQTFNRDDRCNVTWTSNHLRGPVQVELWSSTGKKPFDILGTADYDSSFSWKVFPRPPFGVGEIVPTYPGPWLIYVRSVRCPEIFDKSNATFNINLPG
jgi:hypothetical protein